MVCRSYSPDIQAMGDCRNCGHTYEAHNNAATTIEALEQENKRLREALQGSQASLLELSNGYYNGWAIEEQVDDNRAALEEGKQ